MIGEIVEMIQEPYYYLAGPMSGLPEWGFPIFNAAAAKLRAMGIVVVNPAENFGGDVTLPYHVYLRRAFQQVAGSLGVIRLPGWERSNGANKECELARWCSLPLYDYEAILETGL
jgi:hypothetical protein